MYRAGDLARWRRRRAGLCWSCRHQLKLARLPDEPAKSKRCCCAMRTCAGGGDCARGYAGRPAACWLCGCGRGGERSGCAGVACASGGSLPDYMVPAGFVVLDRSPASPNGKLDGARCLRPSCFRWCQAAPRMGGGSSCGLFAELLGLAAVGIEENFFELGGDSIMSIQLVSRARQAGSGDHPARGLRASTVAALAAAGEGWRRASSLPDIAAGRCRRRPIMHWLIERGGPIERVQSSDVAAGPAGLRELDLRCRAAGGSGSSRCVAAAACRFRAGQGFLGGGFALRARWRRRAFSGALILAASTSATGAPALRRRHKRRRDGLPCNGWDGAGGLV